MKQKIFLDTNVILDLLGERVQFYTPMAQIASLADYGKIRLHASTLSYSTIYYVLSKFEKSSQVKDKIKKFRLLSKSIDLTDQIIEKALLSEFRDFEDGLQYFSALTASCNSIITRNAKDFKSSAIPVMSPIEYLASLSN